MAQNISLMGASYPDVPSVKLPKTGGGQATFVDVTGAKIHCMEMFGHLVTPGTTSNRLTIPATNLDSPIQLIIITAKTPATINAISATTSSTYAQFVLFAIYDRNENLFDIKNVHSPYYVLAARPRNNGKRVYIESAISSTSTRIKLMNEAQIKTGGAYIYTPNYVFRSDITYGVQVGG